MKLALNRRVDKSGINVRITEPIMKVKTQQFKIEAIDQPIEVQIAHFKKMQKILTHQAAGKGQKVPVDTQVKLKLLETKLFKY